MKSSQFFISTLKEAPADAEIVSHKLMLRAGFIKRLGVKCASPDQKIRELSGGNQQKVLLARWMCMNPKALLLDEPTRGIDVGAKADIQRKVAELSAEGLSVVFISSELEEVIRIAQRIVVLRDRSKIGELDATDVTVDDLVALIAQESGETTTSRAVVFEFTSPDPDALRFDCRFDSGPWRPCRSPQTYAGPASGPHLFQVAAIDRAGNRDPTPAIRRFFSLGAERRP